MDHKLFYKVLSNGSLNRFLHSDIRLTSISTEKETMNTSVSNTEGYYQVDYPVRKKFLKNRFNEAIPYINNGINKVYIPFENTRVDFSSFISVPHRLECYVKTYILSNKKVNMPFRLKTCGGTRIWVNGNLQEVFEPFTRNHGTEKIIQLSFERGKNEILVYFDDLAERDVNYYFELLNLSKDSIKGFIPIPIPLDEFSVAETFLYKLYFDQDIYRKGEIKLVTPDIENKIDKSLKVRLNPEKYVEDDMHDGNITDFKYDDFHIDIRNENSKISIGTVDKLKTAGITTCQIGYPLSNGEYLTRRIKFTLYNQEKFKAYMNEDSLEKRKSNALFYFASLPLEDINVLLANIHLGNPDKDFITNFNSAFKLIETKGDCADFVLVPMLSVYAKEKWKFPKEMQEKVKELAINFRYWIDEPGNDVMWYFSENHALLFHISQYYAGYLFPEEVFTVSKRSGSEQYHIAKSRLVDWFDNFYNYGFTEWNSTTYLPIDLIGFFGLYLAAPDQEIKDLAKRALDYTFKIIAINYHGGTLSSTYGRSYEHNLKAMPLGEISNILSIAWRNGYFNNALRPSTLFAISDYSPPDKLIPYMELNEGNALKAEYKQGKNQAYTYIFKCKAYSLASLIDFKANKKGHQQHVLNISLGSECTLLWINHPGEIEYSGENRPSFWAGNGDIPLIKQYQNLALLHYKLKKDSIPFIHMYLPYWELDNVIKVGKWIFIKKDDSYLAAYFSNGYEITNESAISFREVRSNGLEHQVLLKCSSSHEVGSFERFQSLIKNVNLTDSHQCISLNDYQFGSVNYFKECLYINDQAITYDGNYILNPTLMKGVIT
ncbi:hypothetical protein CR203_11025 [Salipaludibacillus neizhouensis]|uniref:Uncharacterized protein n=1 Tax=Salipaludibacillus neizhouensis TaxID=885475 RepID=A0A3A9K1R2_9BACI|nr:hypothetical protein [Salipaludibacillus neizhouensis]RKL67044.1 hypothetical protein CR203_11025 [Salipaludibacillus neizhouensis]